MKGLSIISILFILAAFSVFGQGNSHNAHAGDTLFTERYLEVCSRTDAARPDITGIIRIPIGEVIAAEGKQNFICII